MSQSYEEAEPARDQSVMARAGIPTTVVFGGTSSSTTALVPMRAPAPHLHFPQHLGPGPDGGPRPDLRADEPTRGRSHCHPREERHTGLYLDQPVDHDLSIRNEHTGMHDCPVRDRDLPGKRSRRRWAIQGSTGIPSACRRAFIR